MTGIQFTKDIDGGRFYTKEEGFNYYKMLKSSQACLKCNDPDQCGKRCDGLKIDE